MCKTTCYTSPSCKCHWMRVTQPCFLGAGFSTCPRFFNDEAKPPPPRHQVGRSQCPVHGLRGAYDRNHVRMVDGVTRGLRWGLGPGREDYGVDLRCVVM